MHWLQWMQRGRPRVPAMRFDEVGLAQEGTGHGDEREALGHGELVVAASLMPPSRMIGTASASGTAGDGEEVGLLVGVGGQEPCR